jgi:carboxymethylenebutenolidase
VPDIALPYFLSLPDAAPPWPGVVVIHEGNGISSQLLRVCERLAGEGYATIAPDLFFRVGGSEASDFATLMGSLDRDRTQGDVAAAAAHLKRAGATRLGVTGFCMGGMVTYRTAVSTPGFDAAAGFYGMIVRELGEPACPTLLFYGGSDEYIPMSDIETIRAHHPETYVYPEAGHGFMRDGSDSYREPDAKDAWARMLALFAEHLT